MAMGNLEEMEYYAMKAAHLLSLLRTAADGNLKRPNKVSYDRPSIVPVHERVQHVISLLLIRVIPLSVRKRQIRNFPAQNRGQRKYGIDEYPNGTNAVVCVISYTGYDMEDAMIINKSAMERGFGHGTVYKTLTFETSPSTTQINHTNTKLSPVEAICVSSAKLYRT